MSLTWDLIILLVFAVSVIYGALLGRNRILGILVNSYIGIVVAEVMGETIYNAFSGLQYVSANFLTSVFGAKVLVMIVVIGLLALRSELSGIEGYGFSKVQGAIYGFLTSGLLLSSAISFMTESEKVSLFAESNFASLIEGYYVIWVVAPVLVMIGSTFIKGTR